jgi:hypothetical protein
MFRDRTEPVADQIHYLEQCGRVVFPGEDHRRRYGHRATEMPVGDM